MILTSDIALEAVNEMLSAIGESPVNTLESSENVDVIDAIKYLERVNREVQSRGWSFNVQESVKLNPDIYEKKIKWQDDMLYIVGADGTKYTQQGEYIYDFDNQTDTFDTAIEVDVIREIDFQYLPFPVRNYIVARATRIFNMQRLIDTEQNQHLQLLEQDAWAALQEYDMELNGYTMFNNPGVQELMDR